MISRDPRYAHWQQQADDELDYEPEPGFYAAPDAPPDPPTVWERVEVLLSAEHRRRTRQEDPCPEP
jgi:hypothetical protein